MSSWIRSVQTVDHFQTLDAELLGPFAYMFAGCHREACVCLTQFSKSILLSNLKSPPLGTAYSIIPQKQHETIEAQIGTPEIRLKFLLELIIHPSLSASPLVRCNQETLPMTRWISDSGDVGDVGSSLSADNFNKRRARQSRNLGGSGHGRFFTTEEKLQNSWSWGHLNHPEIPWVWMYISEDSHDWSSFRRYAPATIRIFQYQVTRGPAWQ